VIVLNWNGWGDTIECLETVLRGCEPGDQVVVCDNRSTDGSPGMIKAWAEGRLDVLPPPGPLRHLSHPPVPKPIQYVALDRGAAEAVRPGAVEGVPLVLIDTGGNLGYAGGNNVGLRFASRHAPSAYVMILNNDAVLPPDFMPAVRARVSGGEFRAAVIGFAARLYDDPAQVEHLYSRDVPVFGPATVVADGTGAAVVEPGGIGGCALLIGPDVSLRELPEEYFLYYEDAAYSQLLRRRGYRLAADLENAVYHKVSRSAGGPRSPLQLYYERRNKLYYMHSFKSFPEFGLFLCATTLTTVYRAARFLARGDGARAAAVLFGYLDWLRRVRGRSRYPATG